MSEESEIEADLKLYEIAQDYLLQAMNTVPAKKIDAMLADWAKGHLQDEPDDDQLDVMLTVSLDACLFTPSLSGSTPMSRFLASVKTDDPAHRQALAALSRSEIRLVRIRNRIEPDLIILEDMVNLDRLTLVDSDFVEESEGFDALMRLCRLDSGRYILISFPFALDEEGFRIVESFSPPGKGIRNPYRCACAVYKHAIREGITPIPVRELTEDEIAEAVGDDAEAIAILLDTGWAAAKDDPEARAEFVTELRDTANPEVLLSYLNLYSLALDGTMPVSADNIREICEVVVEALAPVQHEMFPADGQLAQVQQMVSEYVEQGHLSEEIKTFLDKRIALHRGPG